MQVLDRRKEPLSWSLEGCRVVILILTPLLSLEWVLQKPVWSCRMTVHAASSRKCWGWFQLLLKTTWGGILLQQIRFLIYGHRSSQAILMHLYYNGIPRTDLIHLGQITIHLPFCSLSVSARKPELDVYHIYCLLACWIDIVMQIKQKIITSLETSYTSKCRKEKILKI